MIIFLYILFFIFVASIFIGLMIHIKDHPSKYFLGIDFAQISPHADMNVIQCKTYNAGDRVRILEPIQCSSVVHPSYNRNTFNIIIKVGTEATVVGAENDRLIVSPDGLPFDIAIDPFISGLIFLIKEREKWIQK